MKKYFFSLFIIFFAIGISQSQIEPKKAFKKASKALNAFNLDQKNNADKLIEAKEMIEIAAKSESYGTLAKTWNKKGEIYNAAISAEANKLILDQTYKVKEPQNVVIAFESFKKAISFVEKKYEKKEALEGLQECENYMNIIGNNQIMAQDYAAAYETIYPMLEISKILSNNQEKTILTNADDFNNQMYITAYCANKAGKTDRAKQLFTKLIEKEYNEPGIYSNYFNILFKEGNAEDALKVLEKGREAFPEDTEILFAEINYYIQQERYDILAGKLKEAVAKDPNNPSVYSALGNVYMNLFTEEYSEGNKEKAEEYFTNSLDYFNKALELKSDLYDAVYSIGSLYFNKAVEINKEMNQLGMSREDQKKYDVMNKQVGDLFAKALPFFKDAEKADPNDRNTLIALKEIFARMNDFEKSNEFKARLKTVSEGGKNESSYFK